MYVFLKFNLQIIPTCAKQPICLLRFRHKLLSASGVYIAETAEITILLGLGKSFFIFHIKIQDKILQHLFN